MELSRENCETRAVRRTCHVREPFFFAVLVPVEFITRLIYNSIAVGYSCNAGAACTGRRTIKVLSTYISLVINRSERENSSKNTFRRE